jgi:glycerol-3-phosphate dehydrogenase (NAD(P)+)
VKIGIIGTGTWGTALASVLVDNGNTVLMYGRDRDQVDDINNNHRNTKYYGTSINLSESIKATSSIDEFANRTPIVILSVPSSAMRTVLVQLKSVLDRKTLFINTAKGFDSTEKIRIAELIREIIPENLRGEVVSLIGPSHAEEVIVKHLTLLCAVSKSLSRAKKVQRLFSNDYFRVYTQKDEIGAEYSVAMKNVIAIASGIIDGLKCGDNAKAALVTRGLSEMIVFGKFFGGKEKTYLGLTGIGDLMVTCNSLHSRNYRAGLCIGKDDSARNFLKNNTETVEGLKATEVIYEIARSNNLSLPIVEALYSVLYRNAKPSSVIKQLMIRPLRSED